MAPVASHQGAGWTTAQAPQPASSSTRAIASHIRPGSVVAIFPARHYPTTPWHEHDFFELAVIESGRGQHVTDQSVELVERGAAFLPSPGTGHEYRGGEGAARLQLPVSARSSPMPS